MQRFNAVYNMLCEQINKHIIMKKLIIIILLLCVPVIYQSDSSSKELRIYGLWTGESIKATERLLALKKEKRNQIIDSIYNKNYKL